MVNTVLGKVPAEVLERAQETQRETSAQVRARVVAARKLQQERYREEKIYCNAQLTPQMLEKYCVLDEKSLQLLSIAARRFGLSMRGRARIRKVARTIADLEGSEQVLSAHVAEALQYRHVGG